MPDNRHKNSLLANAVIEADTNTKIQSQLLQFRHRRTTGGEFIAKPKYCTVVESNMA
jgi:hypothetical protein